MRQMIRSASYSHWSRKFCVEIDSSEAKKWAAKCQCRRLMYALFPHYGSHWIDRVLQSFGTSSSISAVWVSHQPWYSAGRGDTRSSTGDDALDEDLLLQQDVRIRRRPDADWCRWGRCIRNACCFSRFTALNPSFQSYVLNASAAPILFTLGARMHKTCANNSVLQSTISLVLVCYNNTVRLSVLR